MATSSYLELLLNRQPILKNISKNPKDILNSLIEAASGYWESDYGLEGIDKFVHGLNKSIPILVPTNFEYRLRAEPSRGSCCGRASEERIAKLDQSQYVVSDGNRRALTPETINLYLALVLSPHHYTRIADFLVGQGVMQQCQPYNSIMGKQTFSMNSYDFILINYPQGNSFEVGIKIYEQQQSLSKLAVRKFESRNFIK